MQALGDRLDAVYDVTLAYTLHPLAVPTSADADEPRPSEHDLLRGTLPRTVHRDVQLTLTLTVTLILTLTPTPTLTLSQTLSLTLTLALTLTLTRTLTLPTNRGGSDVFP